MRLIYVFADLSYCSNMSDLHAYCDFLMRAYRPKFVAFWPGDRECHPPVVPVFRHREMNHTCRNLRSAPRWKQGRWKAKT